MEKTYQRKETHFILKSNAKSNQKGLIKHDTNTDEPNSWVYGRIHEQSYNFEMSAIHLIISMTKSSLSDSNY